MEIPAHLKNSGFTTFAGMIVALTLSLLRMSRMRHGVRESPGYIELTLNIKIINLRNKSHIYYGY